MKYTIWGHCGTGKTTMATKISSSLNIDMLDLDSIALKENWQFVGEEEFKSKVKEFIKRDSYVISGSWRFVLGDLILDDADVIVVLKLSYYTNMKAIIIRTIKNLISGEELHGGNKETFKNAFLSKDSIIYFCHKNYKKRIKDSIEIENKYPEKVVVLTSFKQYEQYMNELILTRT